MRGNSLLESLTIQSGQGAYRVDFVETIEEALREAHNHHDPRIVADERVAQLYAKEFQALNEVPIHLAPANEDEKTLEGVGRLLHFFQTTKTSKRSSVIAIGGGIMQDIATFASYIFYRGIPWTFIPTTLLSMADSSIGAKCAINFGAYKNQLGFFNAPTKVIVCERFLETLVPDDLRSGYGEIIKLFLTGSKELFEELESVLNTEGMRSPKISEFIRNSLKVKTTVIEADEYEKDYRRILNYGHTFCHSLESLTHHEVPHGLAVAWGVDLANFVSTQRGLLAQAEYERIHHFIKRHFATAIQAPYSAREIVEGMRRDKKAADGIVSLILLERIGKLQIVPVALDASFEQQVQAYLERDDIFARS